MAAAVPAEAAPIRTVASRGALFDRSPDAAAVRKRRLVEFVLLAAIACQWSLLYGYQGLWHDARLYTLQALAVLKPALYGGDIFLRFGSQDSFTVFSPLYSTAISHFGLEHAAALITFASQIAFLGSAWFLARRLLTPSWAWLGLAMLIALPGDYGAYSIFRYIESFVTPRPGAEALVLVGIGLHLRSRTAWAWGCMFAAALLHPLMACAGFVFLLCSQVALPRPRLTVILCAAGFAAAALVVEFTPLAGRLTFDTQWLTLLWRTKYLFLSEWSANDWLVAMVPAVTLVAGMVRLESPAARTACTCALIVGVAGVALSYIGGDVLHIVLVVQGQAWRWLWLTNAIAAMTLPLIVITCWKGGETGKAAGLLLVATWLLREESFSPLVAALCLVMTLTPSAFLPQRARRLTLIGTCLLFAFAVLWCAANLALFATAIPEDGSGPHYIRIMRAWSRDGSIPAATLLGVWLICSRLRSWPSVATASVTALGAIAVIAPTAAAEWTHIAYTPELYRAFEPWRRLIPPGTDVLWTDSPVPSWLLLERPGYVSTIQTTAALFTRTAGVEMDRRLKSLGRFPDDSEVHWQFGDGSRAITAVPTLANVCATSDVRFIATRYDMKAMPVAVAPKEIPARYQMLRLYRCEH